MTRKEAERRTIQADTLVALGFTRDEAESLRRISMTLQRWYERECGSDSVCTVRGRRNGEDFIYDDHGAAFEERAGVSGRNRYWSIPDRETGAVKRLKAIIEARNSRRTEYYKKEYGGKEDLRELSYYLQTDPRGAALYILRPGDVPEGADVASYYSRGICVY